ncbi:S8 family serine peptidase [Paenibacillus marinisediminis]
MFKKWVSGILAASLALTLFSTSALAAPIAVKAPFKSNLDISSIQLSDEAKERLKAIELEQRLNLPARNFLPQSDGNEIISVIVELRTDPLIVHEAKWKQSQSSSFSAQEGFDVNQFAAHLTKIVTEQSEFQSYTENQLQAQVTQTYDTVFNGMAMEIAANKVDVLLSNPLVKAVYPNNEMFASPVEHASALKAEQTVAEYLGAGAFWNKGIKGEGIKVGVLDTGMDYNHPDLKSNYFGGYDAYDDDDNPFETRPQDRPANMPPVNERGNAYETSHGTHVAGIIAGSGTVAGGMKGVAPEADLYAYRVLGPYGSGSTETVLSGIDHAVKDGMDVINLSLGSEDNDQYSADSVALNNAMLKDIVVVVSSGNSGPGHSTAGTPSVAETVISVGNTTLPTLSPTITVLGKTYVGDMLANSVELGDLVNQSLPVVHAGLGSVKDFEGIDVKGKIALIQRGGFSFGEKASNAQQAGAKAVIIYNNTEGYLTSVTLGDYKVKIPAMGIRKADGEFLIASLKADPELKVTLNNKPEADFVNDSSSRGPALPKFNLKPDISAPGSAIRSTLPAFDGKYEKAYGEKSGTSMAAPQVAGAAALLRQYNSDWSAMDIKTLLMNTSKNLVDRTGAQYSYSAQGAGRIDLNKVLEAHVIAKVKDVTDAVYTEDETDYITGSLSFGLVIPGNTVTKNVYLSSIDSTPYQYTIQTELTTGSLTTSVTDLVYGTNADRTEFKVTLTVPEGTSKGYYEGSVKLVNVADPADVIRLPLSYTIGNPLLTRTELSTFKISPNGDGSFEDLDYQYMLTTHANRVDIVSEMLDLETEEIAGQDGVIYSETNLKPRGYRFTWDGSFIGDSNGKNVVKDGLHLLTPYVNDKVVEGDDYSNIQLYIADSTAPTYTNETFTYSSSEKKAKISGTITGDLFIDLAKNGWLRDAFGLNLTTLPQVVGVAAVDANGKPHFAKVDAQGNFTVEVPLNDGTNNIDVYVYDMLDNGSYKPAFTKTANVGGSSGGYYPTVPTSPDDNAIKSGVKVVGQLKKSADGKTADATMNSDWLKEQLKDEKSKAVTFDLTSLTLTSFEQVNVKLSKDDSAALIKSGKDLIINGKGFDITIPAAALEQFLKDGALVVSFAAVEKDVNFKALDGTVKKTMASPLVTLINVPDKLKAAVTITWNPGKDAFADLRKATAYSKKADDVWNYLGLQTVQQDGSFILSTTQSGTYAVIENVHSFTDINKHWASDFIEVIAAHNIMKGLGNNKFSPNTAVTQAEFATMLDRIQGKGDTWSTRSKETGANQKLSRENMVQMLVTALGADLSKVDTKLKFDDQDKISKDAKAAVAYAVQNGWIIGKGNNKFDPAGTTTRAEAAKILYTLLKLNKHI